LPATHMSYDSLHHSHQAAAQAWRDARGDDGYDSFAEEEAAATLQAAAAAEQRRRQHAGAPHRNDEAHYGVAAGGGRITDRGVCDVGAGGGAVAASRAGVATSQQTAAGAVGMVGGSKHSDPVVREVRREDGKRETWRASGRRWAACLFVCLHMFVCLLAIVCLFVHVCLFAGSLASVCTVPRTLLAVHP
jgi:hypothetical protein